MPSALISNKFLGRLEISGPRAPDIVLLMPVSPHSFSFIRSLSDVAR